MAVPGLDYGIEATKDALMQKSVGTVDRGGNLLLCLEEFGKGDL